MRVGEIALGGPAFVEENRGVFWSKVITRPYMRTRQALADLLIRAGRVSDAAAHYRAMLDLNPNDNQGIRYTLLGALLVLGDLEAVRRVLDQFPDERFAVMRWARVLERWLSGDRRAAARVLRQARDQNGHVEGALLARGARPQVGQGWTPGTPSEAAMVVDCLGLAWRTHGHALEWLRVGGHSVTQDEVVPELLSYTRPVSGLMGIGAVESGHAWPDYRAEYGLTAEHVSDLVRMATSDVLHEFDSQLPLVWAPLHAWRALAQIGDPRAIEPLVRLLRERWDDDSVADDLPDALAKFGAAAFDPLHNLIADGSDEPDVPLYALMALRELAKTVPGVRERIIETCQSHLARFETNGAALNSALIDVLADLGRDPSDLPLIEQVFESGRVSELLSGSLERVRKRLRAQSRES